MKILVVTVALAAFGGRVLLVVAVIALGGALVGLQVIVGARLFPGGQVGVQVGIAERNG